MAKKETNAEGKSTKNTAQTDDKKLNGPNRPST